MEFNFEFDATELMRLYRKALSDAYCMIVDTAELEHVLNERGISVEKEEG